VEEGEWRIAESFGDPEREAARVRQGVGLEDLSALGKLDLKGRDLEPLLASAELGSDVAVLRLTSGHVVLLTAPGAQAAVAGALLGTPSRTPGCAHLTDVTSAFSTFALIGPRARELLARLTSLDVRPQAFPNGGSIQGGLAKVHVILQRDDWGPLPVFRLLLPRDVGEYAWHVICEASESLDLIAFGLTAERLLRGRTE
jgi:sarcosine oxidase subunit alpha